jgi:proteasome lid subunit RPN8/RPN11
VISSLELPANLRVQLEQEARRAFPRECCGLLEGVCEGAAARAAALHPTTNLAAAPDKFEIDPVAHFALLHRLHGGPRRIIGCYHSHPNGKSEPSARDAENATEDGFLWLIASLEQCGSEPHLCAFVSTRQGFVSVRIETPP